MLEVAHAVEALEEVGGRLIILDEHTIRHIGPEKEIRELAVATLNSDRYTAANVGPNRVGSYTLDLKVKHGIPGQYVEA